METKTEKVEQAVKAMPEVSVEKEPKQKIKTVLDFCKAFVENKLGNKTKHGGYRVIGNELRYYPSGALGWRGREGDRYDTLAVRIEGGAVICNAAILRWQGTSMAWGSRTGNSQATELQRAFQEAGYIMVPFNALKEAGMKLETLKVLDQGGQEDVMVWTDLGYNTQASRKARAVLDSGKGKGKYRDKSHDSSSMPQCEELKKRHFVGSILMESDGKCMLFDIDRNEVIYGLFNPFVVQVPVAVKTIKEAYEVLIPEEVKEAKAAGLDVLRQGEWFFIPHGKDLPKMDTKPDPKDVELAKNPPSLYVMTGEGALLDFLPGEELASYMHTELPRDIRAAYNANCQAFKAACDRIRAIRSKPIAGQLRAGPNRPNNVEQFIHIGTRDFVRGKVEHSGREHHTIVLKEWHWTCPNTAIKSFTIQGDVD